MKGEDGTYEQNKPPKHINDAAASLHERPTCAASPAWVGGSGAAKDTPPTDTPAVRQVKAKNTVPKTAKRTGEKVWDPGAKYFPLSLAL